MSDETVELRIVDSGSGGEESGSGSAGSGIPRRRSRNAGSDDSAIGTGAGTGDTGGDGDRVGAGKRGRGRPRKVTELAGEIPSPAVTEKASRGRKRGPDLSVLVETTIVGLFGLVAVATAHEHWLKDREEVMAITGPLNAWIDQLPAKTLKKVEKNLAPALLVVGIATVIGPDAVLEMKLRERNRRAVPAPTDRFFQAPAHQPSERPNPGANGVGAATRGEGGWHSGIPAVPPIGSDFDV